MAKPPIAEGFVENHGNFRWRPGEQRSSYSNKSSVSNPILNFVKHCLHGCIHHVALTWS